MSKTMDSYQKIIYKKFPQTSWLSDKSNMERIMDWTTFYRRNIPVFVEHYLGIPLHWYQIIWLYMLNAYISVVIIAGRASAKSFVIAIFSCAKCILYPNTKVVIASGKNSCLLVRKLTSNKVGCIGEVLRYYRIIPRAIISKMVCNA